MGVEENKAVIRRVAEKAFGEGDFSEIDKLLASNYVLRGSGIEVKGLESFKQFVTMFRNAFPDIHFVMDDMVGEGDKVAFHYTMRGTFKGEYMGMAPTGNQFVVTSSCFMRFEDGKEVEALEFFDTLAFYQQLGVSPPSQ